MAEAEGVPEGLKTPKDHIPINVVESSKGEIIKLGAITCRIMEDGSRTDHRLGIAEFHLPPHTSGPPLHWHEMHDETFLVTAGQIRFSKLATPWAPATALAAATSVDARAGDLVTVPVRAPHTFGNPHAEEARVVVTFSPSFYVEYFRLLGQLVGAGDMTPEKNLRAMARFATVPVGE